jgi:hypothetical protein
MSRSSVRPQLWGSTLTRQWMIAVAESKSAPLSMGMLCGVFVCMVSV